MDFGLFSWERSYRKSYLKNIVKNIVKKYSEMMEFLCEFLIEPHWTHGRGAPTRRIWKGQAIPPLLLQSHLPHCQPVYFAELQCQYLPPWSYHTLSSCCQRAYRLINWFKISLEFNTVRRARGKEFCSHSLIWGIKLWLVLSSPAAKTRTLCRASDGYRLGPMPPQRLVPAAASSDGAAAASTGRAARAVMVSPCGDATLGILGGGDCMAAPTALQSRHGSPCSAFFRVDGGSECNFEN